MQVCLLASDVFNVFDTNVRLTYDLQLYCHYAKATFKSYSGHCTSKNKNNTKKIWEIRR